jgi:hypothetical protein
VFSPFGDLQDLADGRLHHHEHDHGTRSSKRGDIVQQAKFPTFIKKCAVMYNEVQNITKACKSKMAAKKKIREWCAPTWAAKSNKRPNSTKEHCSRL